MSDWSKVTRPIPVPNEWTKPFWDAARRNVLELQRCQSCGHFQHPPYATCVQCVSTDLKFEPVRGGGAIYAYTIMYHTGVRATHSRPYNSTIHDTRSRASTKDFGPDAQLPVLERTRVDRCIMLATAPSTSNDVRHQRLCASLYLSPVVQSGYLESPNKCLR